MKAIKVIWNNGEEEFLKEGPRTAAFANTTQAERMRDFMMEGMADEVQSINVVPYPATQREARPCSHGRH